MYVDDTFLSANRTPIYRKLIGQGVGGGRIVYPDKRPAAFCMLQNADLVDTTDLCLIFGCSARTVYRWVTDHSLRPFGKIGREFLFTKGEIVRWFNSSDRPVAGRPPPGGR
jgi:predicted DNA-binding transcriptional regulator AlpA